MIGAEHCVGGKRGKRLEVDVARYLEVIGDGNVDVGPVQHLEKPGLVCFGVAHSGVGVFGLEAPAQCGEHEWRERDQAPDTKRTTCAPGHIGRDIVQGIGMVQQRLRVGKEAPASRCEGQASGVVPDKERDPEFPFQMRDRRRDGRR